MGSYSPPVDQLLKLGDPTKEAAKVDYLALGIGREHVADLIRMLNDRALFHTEPEWYAQNHAWRALGQLRAPEAIDPLLDMLAENVEADDWSDWIIEDLPPTLGRFGSPIIPRVVDRIDRQKPRVAQEYARVIMEVGKQHPEARPEAVSHLRRLLETASTNDPTLNAFLISNLIDLKATEAWLAIERAYATDHVDLSIQGGPDQAKFYMGLGPKPQGTYQPARSAPSGQNAKQRFNERQRQKKLAKKQKKRKDK